MRKQNPVPGENEEDPDELERQRSAPQPFAEFCTGREP